MSRPMSSRPYPYPITEQEQQALSSLVDYSSIESLPEIWPIAAHHHGDIIALHDPHNKPETKITYKELYAKIRQFAAGLQSMGIQAGDRIALISDNSPRWFIADQGTMTAGAVNAVRSSQAEREESLFIVADSGSTALIVEDLVTLKKLQPQVEDLPIQFVVLLSDETPLDNSSLKVLNFNQLLERGTHHELQLVQRTPSDLATLIYTSGTSGKPKGVMLSHGNLLHQINTFGTVLQPAPGSSLLSILPSWHSYERTVEYYMLSQGCTQVYTSIRHVKADLKQFKPKYMVAVPRLWESIYEGVQKQFREQPAGKQRFIQFCFATSQRYVQARRTIGNLDIHNLTPSLPEKLGATLQAAALWPIHALADRLVYKQVRAATGGEIRYIISGGGSLAMHLETFYEIVDIRILVGYGLTETSPVVTVRRPERNLRRSSGLPMPATEIRIVDLDNRKPLPQGQQGLVLIRGPQIMQGYYGNPEATAKAIDPDGWFDSGDLGWLTPQNDLVVTGRAKDTIVLTNGENIEPQPIEDACLRSAYIDQIMLVGQDQRTLGALIVPNWEALQKWAVSQNVTLDVPESVLPSSKRGEGSVNLPPIALDSKPIQDLMRAELNREVKERPGYRPDDRIGPFQFVMEPFSIENGMMTQTLKIRRAVVMDHYRAMIDTMFAQSSG